MKRMLFVPAAALAVWLPDALCQPPSPPPDPQPIYRVTVVSRTLPAVNYEHRGGPTRIDFQGTVLLPRAKGDAVVESKRGRLVIDARFDHVEAPTRFGREYLTYVLWAITPEGRPHNLGELLINPSDKTRISVTTDLQAIGLMVTAEPYYSVTMPSDVVVLENVVRPDTIGRVEPVSAKYELMPRGEYTMTLNPTILRTVGTEAESLPYDRYEAVLELYQAQNAVAIARSWGADRYAPDTFLKAQSLLNQAQDAQARKQDTNTIVSLAREAAQMAEDARAIAVKRRGNEQAATERAEQDQARVAAEAQADQARAQAAANQAAADAERAAAERAQAEAARAQAQAAQQTAQAEAARAQAQAAQQTAQAEAARARAAAVTAANQRPQIQSTSAQKQSRAELLSRMNAFLPVRDTPRGLVATVPDSFFEQGRYAMEPAARERIARLATVLAAHPGLNVIVEGYTDDRLPDTAAREFSDRRATEVRDTLLASGFAPGAVRAMGYGRERPVVSNASAEGREQNRRVEIVISGEPIGEMATWDRPYQLGPRR